MKILTVFAFTLTAVCSPVLAQPAKGGVCGTHSFRGPDTVFDCEHIGKVTVKQIYEKGWRISSISQDKIQSATWTTLIIEEQK